MNAKLEMPRIGLGTYLIPADAVPSIITAAIEIGYRHIDTAQVYRNEAQIGSTIASIIASHKVTRSELWITSKISPKNQGANSYDSIVESLKKLQTEYIDLMLIHWPGTQGLKLNDVRNSSNRSITLDACIKAKSNGTVI